MSDLHGQLLGWGMYVPQKIVTNHDLAKLIDTTDEWIKERTGISERRVVAEDEHCSSMAVAAARQALQRASMPPEEVELIIVATSSPDYLTPPVACQVQHMLGAKNAAAFSLVLGCTGFVCALATAEQYLTNGSYKNALVIGVELLSRNIDWKDRRVCVLFGDGAGAVVLKASKDKGGLLSFVLGSDGSGYELLIQPSGGTAQPPTVERLESGKNFLQMNGNEVFKFAARVLGSALRSAIDKANLKSEDIDLFIPHQANGRIIEAAAAHVGLPREKVFINLEKYGNTSAASVPIALCEALEQGRTKIGDIVAFVAFGAGLSWGSAIMRL